MYFFCTGLQHLYCPRMEDEEYGVSTVDKFRLTYDGPDLEIIERIRRMYERVPFGKSKDDEVEGDRKKKRRKPKFLIRLKTDPEFKRKIILTAGLLWSFMILVGGEKLWTHLSFFPNICYCNLLKCFGENVARYWWCEGNNGRRKMFLVLIIPLHDYYHIAKKFYNTNWIPTSSLFIIMITILSMNSAFFWNLPVADGTNTDKNILPLFA